MTGEGSPKGPQKVADSMSKRSVWIRPGRQ